MKLIVSAVITIGLALAVALTVSLQYESVGQASRTERFTRSITRDVSDLNSLGYTYLLLKNRRAGTQWQLKYRSLGRLLSEHAAGTGEEQALIVRLRSDHERMKGLFDALAGGTEERRAGAEGAAPPYDELRESLSSQLMARSEAMINDTSLLERESARRMDAVRQRSFFLVLASAFVLIVSAAATAFLLAKSIGGSIRALERGTQRITAGDLEYRIGMRANDELGKLARSFDTMTERLQTVTVSKDRLQQEVEERKRAEIALKESEQRFATTLSSIGDAVIATDVAGKVTFMNGVAEALTGWAHSEALGQPLTAVFTIVNEKTRQPAENPVDKVLRLGTVVGLANHTVLIAKDGREIPIDDSGAPVVHDGTTLGVVLVFRDFTERRRAEERANHLASFPELNPSPVIEVDVSGNITFCNPATPRILKDMGMGEEDCEGFLPKDLKAILQTWDKKHESILYREVLFGNRAFGVTIHLIPRFSVVRIYAFDITERKQAEGKLLQAKEEWERTFASVPDLVTIIDDQHRILRVNEAMARRLGHKAEECVGLLCFEAVHGLSEPPDFCPHSWTLKDGRQHVEEVHEYRLGGDFLVSTTPLHDEQGRMIGTVHVAHDITERKKAEEALRESERQMARAQEMAYLGNWELDLVNNRLSWSDEVYRIFGLKPQEFGATYEAFLEAVHPEDRAAVDAAYSGSLREGRDTYEIEHRVVRRSNGEVRIVREKCEHVRDETGRIIKSIGMVHDVTERNKAEEALKKAYDGLELQS